MITPMNELIDFLREEICERREYSASKSFEVIIQKIEVDFLEKEKERIVNAHSNGQLWNKSGYSPDVSEKYFNDNFNH
jgi:hypothetical protein